MSIRKKITGNVLNIPGWQTKRRLVVIESDDWGTVRVSSKKAFNRFLDNQFPVDACPYNRNDALECNADLEMLFEVLSSVKDRNNNPAVITANNITANPDFEKIKASGFREYFYEPFTETLLRYPAHDRVMQLYREGIAKKLIKPQFHGREHVNIERWLESLRQGNKALHMAFEESMFSIHAVEQPAEKNEWMDALDADSAEILQGKADIVRDGLKIFKDTWGFASKSFIAPCYIWHSSLEPQLAAEGVSYMQGMVIQLEPVPTPGYQYKKKYHYQGQKNKYGQRYLVRNAFFEPSVHPQFDWVNDCLHRIETAFRWNKPAIISTHRLNFAGWLRPGNRDANLKLLSVLLRQIISRWPAAEFITSDELGDLINKK